jgi:hypothetical protein
MRSLFLASLVLSLIGGCGSNNPDNNGGGGDGGSGGVAGCTTAQPKFATDVQPIFGRHCGGGECHAVSYGFLTMATSECSDGRLIVKAGDPTHSYLIDKLTNHNVCQGRAMPPGTNGLTTAELQTIYDWICAGAKNN